MHSRGGENNAVSHRQLQFEGDSRSVEGQLQIQRRYKTSGHDRNHIKRILQDSSEEDALENFINADSGNDEFRIGEEKNPALGPLVKYSSHLEE